MYHRRVSHSRRGEEWYGSLKIHWFILLFMAVVMAVSYMTRPCLAGTQTTLACLQASWGGAEPRSNRRDIMHSDCTLFKWWEANWSMWKECDFFQLLSEVLNLCLAGKHRISWCIFSSHGFLQCVDVYAWGISICIVKASFRVYEAVCMHPISSARIAAVPSHLSDDSDSESVFCRLVLFISLVMKSLLAEQWAVMLPFNMDLGSFATVTQRQANAQTDGSYHVPPAPIMHNNLTQLRN